MNLPSLRVPSAQSTTRDDTSHDEELALELQRSEEILNDPQPPMQTDFPFPSRPTDMFYSPLFHHNVAEREMNALLRSMLTERHPLENHLMEIMHTDMFNSPRRRIVFPAPFMQYQDSQGLPPHLQAMMRGEEDTSYEVPVILIPH